MLKRALVGALARTGYELNRRPAPGALSRSHPDLDPDFAAPYEATAPYTMTSVERMYALYEAVRHVRRAGIEGDVVECGVWRGGSAMLAALTLLQCGDETRRLWLYDTFQGMSEPGEADVEITGERMTQVWDAHRGQRESRLFCWASLEDVRSNMASTGYPADRVEYVEGRVEDTIPATAPDRIALLRLDTDWYESTRHELEHLYPRLVSGGVLIIDDYGHWLGARQAVDEFLAEAGPLLLNRVDDTGRIAVKP
jgi:hypothetical protein